MPTIITGIIIFIVGAIVGVALFCVREVRVGTKKSRNVARLKKEIQKRGRMTNNEAQDLLVVSDATATNYLQELENRGAIRQIGSTGRHVYYKPR